MNVLIYDQIPLYRKYNCDINLYNHLKIEETDLPVRVTNHLLRNSILTVEDLLKTNYAFLCSLKGFGTGCVESLDIFCKNLSDKPNNRETKNENLQDLTELLPYRKMIINKAHHQLV